MYWGQYGGTFSMVFIVALELRAKFEVVVTVALVIVGGVVLSHVAPKVESWMYVERE